MPIRVSVLGLPIRVSIPLNVPGMPVAVFVSRLTVTGSAYALKSRVSVPVPPIRFSKAVNVKED